MLEPGDQVHHYIVEARVGGGGMASVYRVRHAILQHTLALKVLDPALVDRPDMRRRFLAEGRIQALVRHPAIVFVTDAVVDAPRRLAGLVMEYVEGPNLAELVQRMKEPPSPELFRSIVTPILEALHHGHQEGIVHRDIKPSNILLSRDAAGSWHPRLVDFGIAHLLAEAALEGARITEPDGRMGTPAFMSPEQIDGGSPTPAWDVFAMGCVMYELATGGVHPFERDTADATLAAITRGVKIAPSALHDRVDAAIEDTILAALEKDPARRAPSCAALLERLGATPSRRAAPPRPAEVRQAPAGPPPPSRLETTGPAHQRARWELGGTEMTVGRDGADVALGPVAGLDDLHCVLSWTGHSWMLRNRADNGTRVNGARVTRIPLEDGDLIRVGHQVLKFHTEAARAPLPPTRSATTASSAPTGPRLEVARRHLQAPGPDPAVFAIASHPVLIGTAADCDVRLSEPLAGAHHCRVILQGLDVVVEDLGSAHGTRVDGQRVRFRGLREGATVVIGEAKLRYRQR